VAGYGDVTSIPILRFEFAEHVDVLRARLRQGRSAYAGLIMTSQRAVEAVRRAFESSQERLNEAWADLLLFSVGSQTTEEACRMLNRPLSTAWTAPDASSLADVIRDKSKSDRSRFERPLLFPCSSIRRNDLPDALRACEVTLL
jgi:uroporphyrinogen-III synthase